MSTTPETKPPSHYAECKALATWMDNREIIYCHVPNEAALDEVVGRRIKEQGGKKGVPDFLIFSPPPNWRAHMVLHTPRDLPWGLQMPRGVAIEMKKRDREKPSKDQAWWLETLASLGWLTKLCNGGAEARAFLMELGFPHEATIELPKRRRKP